MNFTVVLFCLVPFCFLIFKILFIVRISDFVFFSNNRVLNRAVIFRFLLLFTHRPVLKRIIFRCKFFDRISVRFENFTQPLINWKVIDCQIFNFKCEVILYAYNWGIIRKVLFYTFIANWMSAFNQNSRDFFKRIKLRFAFIANKQIHIAKKKFSINLIFYKFWNRGFDNYLFRFFD